MKSFWTVIFLICLLWGLAGCQPDRSPDSQIEEPALESPTPAASPESVNRFSSASVFAQWGNSAESSSEFANPEWSASQATGSPDAPGCGDYQFAWASAASDSIETLEVSFLRPVYPVEINIHESFNPDQVVKVEVFNPDTGGYYTVLQKNPVQVDRPCPFELKVAVENIEFKTSLIRITVDQSQLGLGWNEIDAVQLIGSTTPPAD